MSRVMNLSLSEDVVVRHCRNAKVGISALEALPSGGVRLVCSSGDGAAELRIKLKRHVIADDVKRTAFRPRSPLW
jgi:hypothetical protein